jgi:Tfp pilus assembly protein PilZ
LRARPICHDALCLDQPLPSVNRAQTLSPERIGRRGQAARSIGRIRLDGAGERNPGVFVSEPRVAKRHKWRLACEVVCEGRSQRAIVIDLSQTGVFVQTGTRLPPGANVDVRLMLTDAAEPILLRAKVARNKQVPPQLTSVARGGVGLKIVDAPNAYYETIASLEGGDSRRQTGAPAASPAAPAPPAAPKPAGTRFRVRVKQSDGPRSRSVEVLADSPDEARARVLAEVGAGWEAVAADSIA